MPQFLSQHYNGNVAKIMAVFWLLLYVIVNLTSILYLRALAINEISGIEINLLYGLAFFSIVIALVGMKVIAGHSLLKISATNYTNKHELEMFLIKRMLRKK